MANELPTIRRIPDDLWADVAVLLGEEKVPGTRGRPPVSFRKVLDWIFYVLRTGCQWKALPKEYGSGSTAHRRFQQWVSEGVFQRLWVKLLERYDDVQGISWRWQSLDSSSVKSPLGGTRQALTPPTGLS
jgi:transposase